MEHRVTVDGEPRCVRLPDGATAAALVEALGRHPDGVLVLVEGEPLQPVALVSPLPDAPLRVVTVASGG